MKKAMLLLTALMAVSLTGCSSINDYLTNQMMQKSGIYDDDSYQEYEQYADAGLLDADGYYVETGDEAEEEQHAPIHVTFSENNNLNVQYYTDDLHRSVVDGSNCYLNPGDSIYVVAEVDGEVFSSMYSFSGFRIYEYDSEGKRTESAVLVMEESDGEYVLNIPDSFTSTDIAIEPVGSYEMRSISLRDYYTDENDHENDLSGTWIINDKEYTSDTAEISPVASYIISYEYDSNEYFYLSSSPECYYSSNADGVVIFNQREADDETEDYSVELHKYISVTLISDKTRTVTVNGDSKSVQASGELPIDHLKYGDTVTIQTSTEWSALADNRELILTNTERLSSGEYKYTLIVPEKDGEFVFDPLEYTYEHGKITFKCFGSTVTSTQVLAPGSKIYYEQASADTGWWLAGQTSEHCITVSNEAGTKAALEAIHFTPMVDVTVNLPQPTVGGSVEYKLNGTRVYGTSVSTYSGAEITIKFNPWEGWISSITGEVTYNVGDSTTQTVKADGKAIDSVMTEDPAHEPELSLNLEKSVGESMEFTLEASRFSLGPKCYGDGKTDIVSNTATIVSKQKIGTDQPISITMSNRAIQSGTAVRMVITLTDSENNKTSETRYIGDLSNTLDPIYIYQPGTNATSTVWYKAIDITIGVVDIESFMPPTASAHSKVTVAVQSTGDVLHSGDLIEESTKVIVTISPDSGYYVTGKKVTNDIYSDTMKFSDYQKNINTIISNHAIGQYYMVTLDKSDSYATYTYKLDGDVVSGMIYVRAGQKLELTYEITDGKHKLTESRGGLPLVGWGSSDTKATESITITAEMDGTTITRSDFGIETK